MSPKIRLGDPKCRGRFEELRKKSLNIAQYVKEEHEDPLWTIVTEKDLEDFVQRVASQSGENENHDPITVLQLLQGFDIQSGDPYFESETDLARADPLGKVDVYASQNVYRAMVPLVLEAMRETLLDAKDISQEMWDELNSDDPDFDSVGAEAFVLSGREHDFSVVEERAAAEMLFDQVRARDPTITANSMDTSLLGSYAALYAQDSEIRDKLKIFHRGSRRLDKKLDIDMSRLSIANKVNGCSDLTGYGLRAEFGMGMNAERTLVYDAPYRVELRKLDDDKPNNRRNEGTPVFGISFFLRNPNTMVLSQVQDIRGSRVPEATTVGSCALGIAERVGRELGLDRIVTYTHRNHPGRLMYPGDASLAATLRQNFDMAANKRGWDRETDTDGSVKFYHTTLQS